MMLDDNQKKQNAVNQYQFRGLKELTGQLHNKIALVRVDYNVPLNDAMEPQDITRITHSLQSIRYLLSLDAKIILLTHLASSDGTYPSTIHLIPTLNKLLAPLEIGFIRDYQEDAQLINNSHHRIYLAENLRLHHGEVENKGDFLEPLISKSDFYVNDAFSVCHRNHASLTFVPTKLPSYAGLGLLHELLSLEGLINNPNHQSKLAIIGGKKISTKLPLIGSLCQNGFSVALGGALVNNFLMTLGYPIGQSYYEPAFLQEVVTIYNSHREKMFLPLDLVYLDDNNEQGTIDLEGLRSLDSATAGKFQILDIGHQTAKNIQKLSDNHSLIIWNGPLGYDEDPRFIKGSAYVAKHLSTLTKEQKIQSVAGGGDTISMLKRLGLAEQFSYNCTAGGAFLEWLKEPKLAALNNLSSL